MGSNGNYNPGAITTRAELAAVLHRIFNSCSEDGAIPVYAHLKRGFHTAEWFHSYSELQMTKEEAQKIYQRGFDHVRICIGASGSSWAVWDMNYSFNEQTGHYDWTFNQNNIIDNLITTCQNATEAGLTIVLDNHDFLASGWSPNGEGKKVCADEDSGFADDNPDNNNGLLFADYWTCLAKQLKDLPLNVFFELDNEYVLNMNTVKNTIEGIRSTGGNNSTRQCILWSGAIDGKIKETRDFSPIQSDENWFFDMHCYEPQAYTHITLYNEWRGLNYVTMPDAARERQFTSVLRKYLSHMKDVSEMTGRKVWIGEFGVMQGYYGDNDVFFSLKDKGSMEYLADYCRMMNEYGLYSHTLFEMDHKMDKADDTEAESRSVQLEEFCFGYWKWDYYDEDYLDVLFGRKSHK